MDVNSPGQPVVVQAMYLDTLRKIKLFFYLETAVAVQRQIGNAVGVLQKFQMPLW